ncbi:tyrosine-protein phosphatase [Oryzihumus leptocrescens]|uniref:Tyrosine phosphatase family protein n=1 Tax=Oryzihumus leptocrescens TaxID=297536 RepID=A0A542ZGB7_9MICO|nr:tyrosine-protein phosphatase [Oryzihumus leptocrescens]TQL59240.1 tyrosine phosphatase family protein [Oryzihumus leptocrescens]
MGVRDLDWSGCVNARDVGGLPVTGGGRVRAGALLCTDTLDRLDARGRAAFADHAVARIVDLRSPREIGAEHPFAGHPAYRLVPWIDEDRDHERDAEAEVDVHVLYRGSLDRNVVRVGEAVRTVAAGLEDGAVVVHCHAGKDRTGLLVGLLLDLVGVPREVVADDYAHSGERLGVEAMIEELAPGSAERADAERAWRTPASAMHGALEHVDRAHGGTRAYLSSCGVPGSVLDRVAELLVEPAQ